MGLILRLPFENGVREIEIDSEKNIAFLGYDVNYDIAFKAMGGDESGEAKLFRLYQERGPIVFMDPSPPYRYEDSGAFERDVCKDWTMKFVQAVRKQGIKKFGTGIGDAHKDIAEMIVESGLFEQDEFDGLKIYLDVLADDDGEALEWLIDWLKVAIRNSSRYEGNDEALAHLINEYLSDDDVKVTVDETMYYRDDASYENTEHWQYDLYIRGEAVHSWTVTRQARIWNPVTFAGWEDKDYGDSDEEELANQELGESLANILSASIPEVREPDLPDHPESDEAGDFAVLYEFDN